MSYPIVKCSNVIVRSCQRLGLREQRIIFIALSQIAIDQVISPTDMFYISAEQYAGLAGGNINPYTELREASKNLLRRCVTLVEQHQGRIIKEKEFNWLSSAEYLPQEGKVGISFNIFMIPFISLLKQQFTKFELKEITGFRSAYTQPLYLRLMLNMRDGERNGVIKDSWEATISVDELRAILDAEKYEKYGNFKERVLKVAERQINESPFTKFTVNFEEKKIGRKVTSIIFTMTKKGEQVEKEKFDFDFVELSYLTDRQATLTEKQLAMYSDWLSGKTRGVEKYNFNAEEFATKFYTYLRHRNLVPNRDNPEKYRNTICRLLSNPNFVREIYILFLRPIGFLQSKVPSH